VPEGAPSLRVLCARVGFHGGVSLGIFPLDESHKIVILSEVAAPRREAAVQSKDPYAPKTIREGSRYSLQGRVPSSPYIIGGFLTPPVRFRRRA
jgi:hypothetical protein